MGRQRVCCHQRNPTESRRIGRGSRAHRVGGLAKDADSSAPFAAQVQSEVAVIAHTPVHSHYRTAALLACEPVSSPGQPNIGVEAAPAAGEKPPEIARESGP